MSPVSSQGYTTRRAVSGSVEGASFIDTPSLRSGDTGLGGLAPEVTEADLIVHLVNGTGRITDRDLDLLGQLSKSRQVVVAINKVDVLSERELGDITEAARICLEDLKVAPVPISAKTSLGLDKLLEQVATLLEGYEPPPEPTPESAKEAQEATDEEDEGHLGAAVIVHSLGAAVAVVLLGRASLMIPLLDVAAVALAQYLLIGHLGRKHDQQESTFGPIRLVVTVVGSSVYFLLCGKFRWIFPALGLILDAVAAFATTAAVGFIVGWGLKTADRLFPPWIRKMIFKSEKKS
ncbi:MAG: hypothetical protein HY815_18560 [Candidatus Riflebacteria bacterium]|nr:hypothetical protein [Candidatus Riflebacteria bacterium]